MWAHYSGNHSGICLEIDASKFLEENMDLLKGRCKYKNVKYEENPKIGPIDCWDDESRTYEENISFIIDKYSDNL